MTEWSVKTWTALADRGRRTLARAMPLLGPPPVRVDVRIPVGLRLDSEPLTRDLRAVVATVSAQLGTPRSATVAVGVARTDSVELFLDERPVALVRPDGGVLTVPQVVERAHWCLLRRLSTLVHPLDPTWFPDGLDPLERQFRQELLEQVLANGVSLGRVTPPDAHGRTVRCAAELAEELLDEVLPRSVRVTVPEDVLQRLRRDDATAVRTLRETLVRELGAEVPDVHLVTVHGAQHAMRVLLNDVETPAMPLTAGSGWPEVTDQLEAVLRDHASWFVRRGDVVAARRRFATVLYDLIDIADLDVSDTALTACLRSLLANRDSIRNLPRILWQLVESSPDDVAGVDVVTLVEPHLINRATGAPVSHADPEVAASEVRRAIAYENWSGGDARPCRSVASLPVALEHALLEAKDSAALGAAEWRVVRTLHEAPRPETLAAHSVHAIRRLRQALRCLPDPPRVIASRELPPDRPLPSVLPTPDEEHA